jgi:acetyltransferase
LPKGNRIAILTVSGAGGVAAADTAIECGLSLAKLSPTTVERLSRIHPTLKSNPVDLGPSVVVTNPLFLFNEVVEALANDENIDCLMVYFYGAPEMPSEFYSELLSKFSPTKPVATCVYSMGTLGVEQASRTIESFGFPVFSDIETSVRALAAMVKYSQWLAKNKS